MSTVTGPQIGILANVMADAGPTNPYRRIKRTKYKKEVTLRASDGTLYRRALTGQLTRLNGKPKLTKAEKKRLKRERVKARRLSQNV